MQETKPLPELPLPKLAMAYAKPIRTAAAYDEALDFIARLLREPHEEGTAAHDALEIYALLVEDYDKEHGPDLGDATPQEVVQFMAEQRGLKAGDLADLLGGRSRLSEFMNGKRPLSLGQIRTLREELGVPADLLIA